MITSGPREIGTPEFRLREVTPADSEDLYRWRMHPFSRPMFRSTRLVPFQAHEKFFAKYFSPENRDQWFVIEAEGQPVGAIALYDLSAEKLEAEWGRLVVAPEARNRGIGSRALALLMQHARQIGLRRLRCEVALGNTPAERIYRNAGFTETARDESAGRIFRKLVVTLDPL